MTTNRDIVHRAFRKIGAVSASEPLDGNDATEGMVALNGMLHEWSLRGVDLSYTSADLADTFPLSAAYEDGTTYMLAARLSPDYVIPPAFDADDFFRAIQAAYMTIDAVTINEALLWLPSQLDDGNAVD